MIKIRTLYLLAAILFFVSGFSQKIKVTLIDAAQKKPFSGNVFLFLSKNNRNPKDEGLGITPFPCFSLKANNINSGGSVTFDDNAISYPVKLSELERGTYFIQAVWDKDLGGRAIASSPGNIYSKAITVTFTKNADQIINISSDQVCETPDFKQTEYTKELKVPSALLNGFNSKVKTIDAAVILPKEYYTQPSRKFPVIFDVSGFGGDYHFLSGSLRESEPVDTLPCITVILDGNCMLGHSVYANSDNNGPWGDALTKELIPALEKNYRCNGARLLSGHSSGGWTVLWLQTQYPKLFAGCWSSSPDPVDFRSVLKINLYEEKSMYYDKDSSLYVEASIAGWLPVFYMKDAYQMENVIYRGEQMHSLDAVFSKKGKDGKPEQICDPISGAINAAVVEQWKKYDISLYLRNNWNKVKPDLDGKIRVSVGNNDNFYLNHSVKLLDEEMTKLNTNFAFEYFPGDHFTVFNKEYQAKGEKFLVKKYTEWLAKNGK